MLLKREEQMKIKAEAQLLKKTMKNPTMHPGYHFPLSKQTDQLLEVGKYPKKNKIQKLLTKQHYFR